MRKPHLKKVGKRTKAYKMASSTMGSKNEAGVDDTNGIVNYELQK